MDDYDAAKDAHDSYYAAIEAKRARGDTHDWEGRPQTFLDGRVTLHPGDCLDVLASLPENSVDSVVVDPPYGLQFMGREWDKLWRNGTEADVAYVERTKGELTSRARKLPDYSATKPIQMQQWHEAWARAVLRVLKPGGHMLAFSATRSYHRMACAIEDGGFEIRDCIMWVYGSGFPKSHDISKAIDRMAGAEREALYQVTRTGKEAGTYGAMAGNNVVTAPATEAARQWQGFGTALKPALEPICVARKPLSESSIAANVLKHGTGAINIDGCRVGGGEDRAIGGRSGGSQGAVGEWGFAKGHERPTGARWPANLIHDGSEEVLAGFPETGVNGRPDSAGQQYSQSGDVYGHYEPKEYAGGYLDSGSAARFFYTAKADAEDRIGSKHPTVKPLDLIQYLVRLITPPGGTCLDCFAGTGTTGEAAWREGFNAILIEREPEYQADIARRMDLATKPTKRAAVAKTKNDLRGAEGTPLFGDAA